MVDDSNCSIQITLWGENVCKRFVLQVGELIAMKAARVSDFNGKSLNYSDDNS